MNAADAPGHPWVRRAAAAVGGAAVTAGVICAGLAAAGAASAEPDPAPSPGPVLRTELPEGVERVVLRDEVPHELPGFDIASLPPDSAGVFVKTDGGTEPMPAGHAERLPDGGVRVTR